MVYWMVGTQKPETEVHIHHGCLMLLDLGNKSRLVKVMKRSWFWLNVNKVNTACLVVQVLQSVSRFFHCHFASIHQVPSDYPFFPHHLTAPSIYTPVSTSLICSAVT